MSCVEIASVTLSVFFSVKQAEQYGSFLNQLLTLNSCYYVPTTDSVVLNDSSSTQVRSRVPPNPTPVVIISLKEGGRGR